MMSWKRETELIQFGKAFEFSAGAFWSWASDRLPVEMASGRIEANNIPVLVGHGCIEQGAEYFDKLIGQANDQVEPVEH